MSADEWAIIRLELQNRRKFQADAAAAAKSVDRIDDSTKKLGDSQAETTRRTWLMNQALFTVRRLVYGFTLAIGAAAVAVGFLGFRFNMMMETARVSFRVLLGSEQAAVQELEYLFELAAKTPFDFPGVQDAARKLLNYGFSLDQTNRYLATFSDIVAGFGGDTTVIERIVRAFGQMRAKGRVMQQELNQLFEAGVNATEYLRRAFGLTDAQLQNIGRLGLGADVAIEAIVRGISLDPRFTGAAEALQQTAQGRLTTFQDYISRLFGRILTRPFEIFGTKLEATNDALVVLDETMQRKGFTAMITTLDGIVGASGRLLATWMFLMISGRAMAVLFTETIIPAFTIAWRVLGPVLIPLFLLLAYTLDFAANHTTILRYALAGLIIYLTLTRMSLLTAAVAARTFSLAMFTLGLITGTITLARILLAAGGLRAALVLLFSNVTRVIRVLRVMVILIRGAVVRSLTLLAIKFGLARVGAFALTAELFGLTAAFRLLAMAVLSFFLTNPVGWAILAIAALTILYFKWEAFHNLVNRTFNFIRDNWHTIALALIPMFRPIILAADALAFIIRNLDKIKSIPSWAARQITGGQRVAPGEDNFWSGLITVPHFAKGGVMPWSGWGMVGEQGPEMMWMPRGATVVPLDSSPSMSGLGEFSIEIPAPVQVMLDSGVLAEAVAKIKLSKRARD